MNRKTETNDNIVEGTEETQLIYRSMLMQHDTRQLLPLQSQRELKMEEVISRMGCWNPRRINRDQSEYPEQKICAEELKTVAGRISECNRVRSIETEYDDDTATANCTALPNTTFRIRLFHGEMENYIIVDMRRMSGCSLVFQEEFCAIMNAARFGDITPRRIKNLGTLNKSHELKYHIPPLPKGTLEQHLLSIKNYLCSECHDVRLLALEDVACTTSEDSADGIALNASKIIMEKITGIRDSIASILLKKEVDAFDGQYIRSLALTILSNVLSTLSKENVLIPLIQDEWYMSSLMPSLIDEVKSASKYPCNASLAAKCLSALFDSAAACAEAGENTMIVLENAKKIGEASYANLETETKVAIEKLVQWKV